MNHSTTLNLRPPLSLLLLATLGATPATGQSPDMSRPVFVGDSLTAGYQNGSLHEAHQSNGYADGAHRC